MINVESIMKFRIIILAALLLAMVSCREESSLKTQLYEEYLQKELIEGAHDSLYVIVNLEYPVAGASNEALQKMTNTILGHSNTDDPISMSSAVGKYIKTRYDNYVETNLPLYEEIQELGLEPSFSDLSWDDFVEGYFSGEHKGIVSYTLDIYTYTGGVHGSSGTYCVNMRLDDGSIVKEEMLFKEGYKEPLGKLLTRHLATTTMSRDDYDALSMKEIMPNGNFRINEIGVTYVYEEYELGPSYIGCVQVTVPWSELADILA